MAIDAERSEPTSLSATELGARFSGLVRERPFTTIAAATLTGATLGGLVFSRIGRFVFLAATAYVATELWRREGQTGTGDLLARVSGALRSPLTSRGAPRGGSAAAPDPRS